MDVDVSAASLAQLLLLSPLLRGLVSPCSLLSSSLPLLLSNCSPKVSQTAASAVDEERG